MVVSHDVPFHCVRHSRTVTRNLISGLALLVGLAAFVFGLETFACFGLDFFTGCLMQETWTIEKKMRQGIRLRPTTLPKTRRAAMRGGQSPVSAVGPLGKFIKTRQEKGGANQNICRIRWRLSPIRPSDGPTMFRQLEQHETGCRGIRVPSDLLAVAEGPLVHPQQSLGLYFC